MLSHEVSPIMDDDYMAVTSQSSFCSSLYQLVWKDGIMIVILTNAVSFFLHFLLGSFSDSVDRPRLGYYSSWLRNQLLLLRDQANLYSEISKERHILCLKNYNTISKEQYLFCSWFQRLHTYSINISAQNCNKKAHNRKLQ